MGCWRGYLSGARCRRAYGPAGATATHCFSKVKIGFTFLVPAHLGSPRKGPLSGCVCVCVPYVRKFSLSLCISPPLTGEIFCLETPDCYSLQCFVLVSICLSVHYFDPFGRWSSCMGGICSDCSTREINNCELFECRLVNNYYIVSW